MVLIADWEATSPIFGEEEGIPTVRWRIRDYHGDMGIKERAAFFLWEWRFARQFQEFCRAHNVVAINQHYVGNAALALHRVRQRLDRHIPLILSFHGSDLTMLGKSSERDLAQWRRLLPDVDRIVVCSNDLQAKVVDLLGHGLKTQVIFNGLDAEQFLDFAQDAEPATERTILNIGKFEKLKGQDVLIEAFAQIADEFSDVKLFLVGADGNELPNLKALSDSLGIGERVSFFPNTPHRQVAGFFRKASLFVLPSRQEAFGIVLLEAGAFKTPAIASNVGGIPEIIIDGETGLLVPPDDPDELARSMRTLLRSPGTATDLGERLQRRVVSDFTWTNAYEQYVAIVNP